MAGVKTETASWQEAEEFDELKKIKFEGKLERSLELLKQFLEYGEAQEKELREKEDSLNQDIRKSEEAQNLVAQKRNLELKKKKAEKDLEELTPVSYTHLVHGSLQDAMAKRDRSKQLKM